MSRCMGETTVSVELAKVCEALMNWFARLTRSVLYRIAGAVYFTPNAPVSGGRSALERPRGLGDSV